MRDKKKMIKNVEKTRKKKLLFPIPQYTGTDQADGWRHYSRRNKKQLKIWRVYVILLKVVSL
jgi:hypothetical protein